MIKGCNCGTPLQAACRLLLATCLAQQGAIPTAHQGKSALHEANRAVAQVVGLPGPFGDAVVTEQALGNCSIRVALASRVECTQRQRPGAVDAAGIVHETRDRPGAR